mgnify:CR=1 FL=1
MNHLVIYSHPNPKSFNHAILEAYTAALAEQGHDVCVRDLYAMDFDPVLSADDLVMAKRKEYAPDVQAEQEKVQWADVVTMIRPVWWGGLTSNLRGYIDRVFISGFAYAYGPGGLQQLLKGKKAVIINTMGESYEAYDKSGMLKSMTQTIDECLSGFTGLDIVRHLYLGNVVGCPDQERISMLEQVKAMAAQLG